MIYSEQEVLHQVRDNIQHYGWAVLSTIFQDRYYSHTVGLKTSFGHPEFEVYGLPHELGTAFLNALAHRVKAGESFGAGEVLDELVEDYEMMLVTNPCDPQGVPITNGRLRIVWQDAEHHYPWEEGCDLECAMQCLIPDSASPYRTAFDRERSAFNIPSFH